MRRILIVAAALSLAACGQPATTETRTEPPVDPAVAAVTDAAFANSVLISDLFEIQSSELAASRAARDEVKAFAAMMVRDHRATTAALTSLLPQLNIPPLTPVLDESAQGRIDTMRGFSGDAFDDAYLDAQVEAHENAVRLFETFIAGAQQGPLRDWAIATLPNLRQHLTEVQALENAT